MTFTIQLELHRKANQTDVLVFPLQENISDVTLKIYRYLTQEALDNSMCKISVRVDLPLIYQTTIHLYKEQLEFDIIADFIGDATLSFSKIMDFGFGGDKEIQEISSEETDTDS